MVSNISLWGSMRPPGASSPPSTSRSYVTDADFITIFFLFFEDNLIQKYIKMVSNISLWGSMRPPGASSPPSTL
jgi:hypothetical protein